MALYRERPVEANAYELGMEDGFNLQFDPETGTYVNKPYVVTRFGLSYPNIGDYIVIYPNGTKEVLSPSQFNQLYEPI